VDTKNFTSEEKLSDSPKQQAPTRFELLLKRIASGSDEAVWELLETYSSNILRVARRRLPQELRGKVDSIDIVQSVWKSFIRRGVPLEKVNTAEQLIAYLGGMAKFKVFETHRHYSEAQGFDVRREVPLSTNGHALAADRRDRPSEIASARENWARAVDKLGEMGRSVVQLKLEGHTLDEIADRVGASKRTVQRLLASVLQSLTT
jgi:RNA polymerase sigma factor (sigma-70 family)